VFAVIANDRGGHGMLREQLDTALKDGLKSKDSCTVSTVRLILAAVKDRDIAARSKSDQRPVDDDGIRELLQTMIKQRRESIEMYTKGSRPDLAEREVREIDVIERFLPAQMDESAMQAAVDAVIQETGASGLKEMGLVMSALRERYPGAMDFSKAGAMARAALS
jgi:uncharacterized protein YqeY